MQIKQLICLCLAVANTLYVGTYGNHIHIMSFERGRITVLDSIPAKDPSYLALAKDGKVIYAVSEKGEDSGVYSFRSDGCGNWQQTAYNPGAAADPCYILPIEDTELVATADYSGGALTLFKTQDGAISSVQAQELFPFSYDMGPVPERQECAHIHQIREIPSTISNSVGIAGRFFLVSDLGNDLIHLRKLEDNGTLSNAGEFHCGQGAGPRHMEFAPDKRMLYYLCELSGEVIAYEISAKEGTPILTEVQRLAAGEARAQGSADIHMHPNGKWLYTSHRNIKDGICLFEVGKNGRLTQKDYTLTGPHPRNFTISPDGKWLLVACRDSRSIQVYRINSRSGRLKLYSQYLMAADKPVCLVFQH